MVKNCESNFTWDLFRHEAYYYSILFIQSKQLLINFNLKKTF
jgi:hypothetical protein